MSSSSLVCGFILIPPSMLLLWSSTPPWSAAFGLVCLCPTLPPLAALSEASVARALSSELTGATLTRFLALAFQPSLLAFVRPEHDAMTPHAKQPFSYRSRSPTADAPDACAVSADDCDLMIRQCANLTLCGTIDVLDPSRASQGRGRRFCCSILWASPRQFLSQPPQPSGQRVQDQHGKLNPASLCSILRRSKDLLMRQP